MHLHVHRVDGLHHVQWVITTLLMEIRNVTLSHQVVVYYDLESGGTPTHGNSTIMHHQDDLNLKRVLFRLLHICTNSTLVVAIVDLIVVAKWKQCTVGHRYIRSHKSFHLELDSADVRINLILLKSEWIYSIRADVLQQHEEGTGFNFGI